MAKSSFHWVAVRIFWLQPGLEAASEEELVAQLTAMGPPPGPTRLQYYPRSKEFAFGDKLPPEWDLHPVVFDHVLHVLEMEGRWRYTLQVGSEGVGGGGRAGGRIARSRLPAEATELPLVNQLSAPPLTVVRGGPLPKPLYRGQARAGADLQGDEQAGGGARGDGVHAADRQRHRPG